VNSLPSTSRGRGLNVPRPALSMKRLPKGDVDAATPNAVPPSVLP
jgi:hypothetical protein